VVNLTNGPPSSTASLSPSLSGSPSPTKSNFGQQGAYDRIVRFAARFPASLSPHYTVLQLGRGTAPTAAARGRQRSTSASALDLGYEKGKTDEGGTLSGLIHRGPPPQC